LDRYEAKNEDGTEAMKKTIVSVHFISLLHVSENCPTVSSKRWQLPSTRNRLDLLSQRERDLLAPGMGHELHADRQSLG
jgi:hypothetical protein